MRSDTPSINQLLITAAWFSFTLFCFAYLTFERLTDFDPNRQLELITAAEFQQQFIQAIDNVATDSPPHKQTMSNSIYHFQQTDCACNTPSQQHVNAMQHAANANGVVYNQITDDAIPAIVPSTPAVAIFDQAGQLVYFGPYGEGLDCSQTNGFALTVFNNYLQGFNAQLLISQAEGCYCGR